MQKPVALLFAALLGLGALTVVPGVAAVSVSGISPSSGDSNGGQSFTISGSAFAPEATVHFGSTPALKVTPGSCTGGSCTQLLVETPALAAGSYTIKVTNPDSSSATLSGFTITNALAPTITSLSVHSDDLNGGTLVTLTGTRIVDSGRTTFPSVAVGGTNATISTRTGTTQLTFFAPPHAIGVVDVVLENPDGDKVTLDDGFTYVAGAAPTVTGVSPSSGGTNGRVSDNPLVTTVTISGTNFAGNLITLGATTYGAAPAVTFGGAVAKVVSVSAGSIVVQPPPHAAGSVDVVVQNPGGQTGTRANGYSYNADPAVVFGSLSPNRGVTGTPVTLTGTGFFDDGALPTVLFGTKPAVVLSVAPGGGSMIVLAPLPDAAPADPRVDVRVTNPDGQTDVILDGFTYQLPLGAVSASPSTVSVNGGTLVTLRGFGFSGSTANPVRVFVGPAASQVKEATRVTVTSAEQLTFFTPDPVGDAAPLTIRVVNGDGREATLANALTLVSASAPTLTSVSNSPGPLQGYELVTITGTGFGATPTVVFEGQLAAVPAGDIEFVSPSELRVRTPANTVGAKDVTVTNDDTKTVTKTDAYTYASQPPTVTAVEPVGAISNPSGPNNGGTAVTIRGTGFAPTHTDEVFFGGLAFPASDVVIESDTLLTAVTPEHVSGTITVTVGTAASGGAGTVGRPFTYSNALPDLDSLSPTSGRSTGGETVVLTGTGFLPGAIVTFGGVEAQVTSVSSNGQTINVLTPSRAAGSVAVSVANSDAAAGTGADLASTLADAFTVITQAGSAPEVAALPSPSTLNRIGGALVSVSGDASSGGSTSRFARGIDLVLDCGTDIPVPDSDITIVNEDLLTFIAPPNAVTETCGLFLTNPDGQTGVRANALEYLPAAPSQTGALSVTSGSTNGNTQTELSAAPASTAAIFVGARIASGGTFIVGDFVRDRSGATILTPPHAAAAATDLHVFDTRGQSGARFNAFTYGAGTTPVVLHVSEAAGPAGGGNRALLQGSGFPVPTTSSPPAGITDHAFVPTVTVGGILSREVVVIDENRLLVTMPSHVAGANDIVVRNPDGSSTTEKNGYTFLGSGGASPTTTTSSTSSSSSSTSTSVNPTTDPTVNPTTNPSSTGPGALTPTTIENANKRIQVTVTRDGDDNVIAWDLPANRPATVLGVQVWRSNSPYTLVQDIPASDPDFTRGEFRDTSPQALATSKYIVTMYYGLTAALGQFTNANAPDTEDYPGVASVDAGETDGDGDGDGLPTWAIVLIALGILFLVVLVAVLIARGRNRDGQQGAAQGYAWQEEGEAKAAEGEWQPPAEVHQARCPACATSFTATGQKPIVTVCPGCGKKGILR